MLANARAAGPGLILWFKCLKIFLTITHTRLNPRALAPLRYARLDVRVPGGQPLASLTLARLGPSSDY